MMAFRATTFAGYPEAGNFINAGGILLGVEKYVGAVLGMPFDIAPIDASILGASAVSLVTAYALSGVLALQHSLHREATDAEGFCLIYTGLVTGATILVLIPGWPFGLIIKGVQTLAGVLLPPATAFLLLLCNDHVVLRPWVNGRVTNLFTGAVIAVLVLLSSILTVSVLYPGFHQRDDPVHPGRRYQR